MPLKRHGKSRKSRRRPADRSQDAAGLLERASLEELDQRLAQARSQPRNRKSGKRSALRPRLSHVAFLLLGLALGIVAFALVGRAHKPQPAARAAATATETKPPATAPAQPAAPPKADPRPRTRSTPRPSAPPPSVVASSDPTVVVRKMLEACFAGYPEIAYAYWAIQPHEPADVQGGLEKSLKEFAADTVRVGQFIDLSQCEFRVRQREGQAAIVSQHVNGVATQLFTLKRSGNTWKIVLRTRP